MGWLLYSATAIWIGGVLIIGGWGFYLETQMANHLLNKPPLVSLNGRRKFAFQRNPNDYDAIGQDYFFLIVVIIGSISR